MFKLDKSLFPDTSVKPYSLESLIAWLRTKEPSGKYDYWDASGGCLIHQWIRAKGGDVVLDYFKPGIEIDNIAAYGKQTFGAALRRAEALQDAVKQ